MDWVTTATKVAGLYARKYSGARGADLGYEDLVQVGIEAALRALPAYREELGTFGTFIRQPVATAIRNAVLHNTARGFVARKDDFTSLDAPVGDGDVTFGDFAASETVTPEEAFERAERESKVRAIVERVTAEFAERKAVVQALVERLMAGEVVEQRFRSEVSLADIAGREGVSRQAIAQLEQRLRARLAAELSDLESDEE